MPNRVYVRDGRYLIRLSEATPEQRRTCDRVILDNKFEVIKVIPAKKLRLIDANLSLVNPVDRNKLTIGDVTGFNKPEDRLIQLI